MTSVCVIGIGDTDYAALYKPRQEHPEHDAYGLATNAFLAAVEDADVRKEEIDGLVTGPQTSYNRLAQILGLEPNWGTSADIHSGILAAIGAISSGLASCVAMVYGQAGRSMGMVYGRSYTPGTDRFLAYTYYRPYGFTSQGALYAMVAERMFSEGVLTPEQLGQVAIGSRQFAALNPRAVKREPIDLDQYLSSRFIAEPLRLLDYCMVNDGGVALVLRRSDEVTDRPRIRIAAAARSDAITDADNLVPRVKYRYRQQYRKIRDRLFSQWDGGWSSIGALYIYDSFSIHVPIALEGLGVAGTEGVGNFLESGATAIGGRFPTNTHGGNLSESYMQGWNHQAEIVRQLRGEAGERQVPDLSAALYVSGGGGEVMGLVYEREDVSH